MFFFSNKWKSQTCCKGVSGAMCCGKIWDSLRVASVVKTKSVLIGHTLNRLKHEVESFWVLPMYIYIYVFLFIFLYFFIFIFISFLGETCIFMISVHFVVIFGPTKACWYCKPQAAAPIQWDVWWVFGLGDPRDIRVLIGLENDTQKRTLVLEYLPT